MRIFISSPLKGLQEVREEILKKEKELDVSFSSMESFLSSPNLPIAECLQHLKDTDAVILIIGPDYGSVDAKTGKSFTHLEYDEAQRLGIKVFGFVKALSLDAWAPEDVDPDIQQEHRRFFEQVKTSGWINSFISTDDLISKINAAIAQDKERLMKSYRPLVEYKDYFHAYLKHDGEDPLFRHDYDLVGRQEPSVQVDTFINSSKKILVIIGRGGIGKSKLIYETARKYENEKSDWSRFLFIKENVNFDDSILRSIPSGRSVLVLEDAHRYDQVLKVLSIYRNPDLSQRLKLIITCRPSGIEMLRMNLSISSDHANVEYLPLKDLTLTETEQLIRQFLKNDEALIDYVKNLSKDCPLAAIIGSRLIAEKKIDPRKIKDSEDFNRRVLDKFIDEYKRASSKESFLDDFLNRLTALAPVRLGDSVFIQGMAKALGIPESKVLTVLGDLEKEGLLVTRGKLARITPDLLSDHILYRACISSHGLKTNFPSEVYKEFPSNCLSNLLFNVSEIEWRAKADHKDINLLEEVWGDIYDKFKAASNYERTAILKQIEKAAVFQPQQALKLVEIAVKPSTKRKSWISKFQKKVLPDWPQEYVLRDLPKILQRISLHLEYLPRCCQLLWDLGKDDRRELNPNPEHAIRILQDIAGYHNPRQSVDFKESIVIFLEALNHEIKNYRHKYTIFDIIDSMLKKEGEYTTSDHKSFAFHPYALNIEALFPIRRRIICILEKKFLQNIEPQLAARAFESLHNALSYAHGSFGRPISDEEENGWLPEQLEIVRIIKSGISSNPHVAMHVLVKKNFHWFTKHARHDSLKKEIDEINSIIGDGYEFRLYKVLNGDLYNFWDSEKSYEERQSDVKNEIDALADEILAKEKSSERIFQELNIALDQLIKYKLGPRPEHLLARITEKSPQVGVSIFKQILSDRRCPLALFSSAFLYPLRHMDFPVKDFHALVRTAQRTRDKNIVSNILQAYAWGGFADKFDQEDVQCVRSLSQQKENNIRSNALWSIAHLGRAKALEAKKLLLKFRISEDTVEQFCDCINDQYGIPFKTFTEHEIKSILMQLLPLNIFERQHFHTEEFLGNVGSCFPDMFVSFLIDRLFFSHRSLKGRKEYTPLPYSEFDNKLLVAAKNLPRVETYLRRIRQLCLGSHGRDSFWLPKLFQAVSGNYSEVSVKVLSEWLAVRNVKKLEAVSLLLREAPENFLFDQYKFVGNLLYEASLISEECLKRVRSNLFGISISGGWTRGHGQPSEKHLNLQKAGKETAEKFLASHPAYSFYMDITKYAEETIKEEFQRDEELEYE